MSSVPQSLEEFDSLLLALQQSMGIVVPDESRGDLVERLEPILAENDMALLSELAEAISNNQSDTIRADTLSALSQPRTEWFLSAENEHLLRDYIFSQLPENSRVWIAGCGTGEIAYYIAMAMAVYEHSSGADKHIEIIATDVSLQNIQQAQQAVYSKQRLDLLRADYRKLFVTVNAGGSGYSLKDKIRQRVTFIHCDLDDMVQSIKPVDLVFCPDALVYYSSDTRFEIIKRISVLLKVGGILLSGNDQPLLLPEDCFERVMHPTGIFYRLIQSIET